MPLGEQCSMTERRADDATRDVADWLKCEFMQDHVGMYLKVSYHRSQGLASLFVCVIFILMVLCT